MAECTEHFLSIVQLKLSWLEQSVLLKISCLQGNLLFYCMFPYDLQKRLASAQWAVLSVLRGFAKRGVLRVKGEACGGALSLTFRCLCCAFSDSLAGCATWCINLSVLLSHEKSCEFPGIRMKPRPF